jgi:hypothetical protein
VDDLYLRILSSNETPAARDAVLEIARAVASHASSPAAPRLVSRLPAKAGRTTLSLRPDRTCFFRSFLVLNSAYFLASQDILALTSAVDAVTAEYQGSAGSRVRVLVLQYPDPASAAAGRDAFLGAYIPEAEEHAGARSDSGAERLEAGWATWRRVDGLLVIALDAREERVGAGLADELVAAVGGSRQ